MKYNQYASIQRTIFLTVLGAGCCIITFGIFSLNFTLIKDAIQWAALLGFGQIIFGAVGTYLTNPDHIAKVNWVQEILERETNQRVSMMITVTDPYEAVKVLLSFSVSIIFMWCGVVKFYLWIISLF